MKYWIVLILILTLLAFTACDSWFVDDEFIAIGKDGHYSDCFGINDSSKSRINDCLYHVGKKQNDPDACKEIRKDKPSQSSCYKNVAIGLGEEKYCAEINYNLIDAYECYAEIGINKKDPDLCSNIDSEDHMHRCYTDYAEKLHDIDTCLYIPHNEESRDACFMMFIEEATNEAFCDKFDLRPSRDDCYIHMAPIVDGNLLCEKVDDSKKRNTCHVLMARKLGTIDECNRMEPAYGTEWNTCATQVAIANKDSALCDLIPEKVGQESCVRQVYSENRAEGGHTVE